MFDQQEHKVSNFDFYVTNYGIWGQDKAYQNGGGWWPRGSQNQYVYGAGIWIGAKKKIKTK